MGCGGEAWWPAAPPSPPWPFLRRSRLTRAPLERPLDPPNDQGSPSPVGRRDVARGIHGVFDGRGGGPRRPPERGIAAGLLLQRPLVSERGLGLVSRRKARGANPRDS